MKVRVNTFGDFFSLFVDIPIRTPAIIEINQNQYSILQTLAKVNGWDVAIVEENSNSSHKKQKTKSKSKKTNHQTDSETEKSISESS